MQSAIKIPGKKYYILYFLLLLMMAMYCYKRPSYNWDMLAYMALAAGVDNHNFQDVHARIYADAKKYVPTESYNLLVQPDHPLKDGLHKNAASFYEKLPFYVVKPLYVGLVYMVYKAGFNLVAATVVPAILSFLFIGLLLFHWLGRYLDGFWALLSAILFMYSAPMVTTAKLSTPDCLAGGLLFAALYFVIEKKMLHTAYVLFLLSVLARIDNILPVAVFLSWMGFSKSLPVKKLMFMLAGAGICYLAVTFLAHTYGWSMFYVNNFTNNWYDVYRPGAGNFVLRYLTILKSAVLTGLQFSHVVIFLFMAVLAASVKNKTTNNVEIKQLLICLLLIFVLRLLLNPLVSDRFYIAYYLIIVVMLVKRICKQNTGGEAAD